MNSVNGQENKNNIPSLCITLQDCVVICKVKSVLEVKAGWTVVSVEMQSVTAVQGSSCDVDILSFLSSMDRKPS